jgi:hypothetical protein
MVYWQCEESVAQGVRYLVEPVELIEPILSETKVNWIGNVEMDVYIVEHNQKTADQLVCLTRQIET